MNYLENDSALVRKLITQGREITAAFRTVITADRHSKKLSVGQVGKNVAWTNAAKERDHLLELLRKTVKEVAENL